VVTLGDAGAWAGTAGHRESTVDARAVTVVDTVGAGDAFTAGLLFALERAGLLDVRNRAALAGAGAGAGESVLGEVLRFASEVACGRRGANPPTLAEVAASARAGLPG
jgi:fructokinase